MIEQYEVQYRRTNNIFITEIMYFEQIIIIPIQTE